MTPAGLPADYGTQPGFGLEIRPARFPAEAAVVRSLFEEYAAAIRTDLCFQGFAQELATLPGVYGPPGGRLLLATEGGVGIGCVALRPAGEGTCEMKRLFVKPGHQGRGIGRGLAARLIAAARAIGYSTMVLDTLPVLEPAIRLYESLGFVRCPAYYDTPLTDTVFMKLRL